MALICPNCQTRNRSIAKFCIECITTLPTAYAEGDLAPGERQSQGGLFLELTRTWQGKWARSGVGAVTSQPSAGPSAPVSPGLWISVGGLVVALAIGAAGWLVAGAGGWYLYTAGRAQVHPPRAEAPEAPGLPDAAPRVALPAPLQAPSIDPPDKVPLVAEPGRNHSALPSPSGLGRAPVTAPAVSVSRAAEVAPSPSTEGATKATAKEPVKPLRVIAGAPHFKTTAREPAAACAGMNFIAAARCMAAQCLKPEVQAHTQCDAVHRQQRLEDEKRNPTAP